MSFFSVLYSLYEIENHTGTDDMISLQVIFKTLRDLLMELLQTWQILDWLSIQASGLMMDGMFLCGTFFV